MRAVQQNCPHSLPAMSITPSQLAKVAYANATESGTKKAWTGWEGGGGGGGVNWWP